jgi:hypothetical protein
LVNRYSELLATIIGQSFQASMAVESGSIIVAGDSGTNPLYNCCIKGSPQFFLIISFRCLLFLARLWRNDAMNELVRAGMDF